MVILREQHMLDKELIWLKDVINARLKNYLEGSSEEIDIHKIQPPELVINGDKYASFVHDEQLGFEERFILVLSLVSHLRPNYLDDILSEAIKNQGEFPQFGGIRGKSFRGILPTVETALFILAGNDLKKRFLVQNIFNSEHKFSKKQILHLNGNNENEPLTSKSLVLDPEYVEMFTVGIVSKPKLSTSFPAELINTQMEWEDLVLNKNTIQQLKEIEDWIKFNNVLLYDWSMVKRIKPGFRCLFHGPPGTGKTLAACLLGKYTEKDVFRIDLSTVVSKFIGETEKNLATLFDKAENKNWVLFFDEADALFGKRTNIRDAHDKYANQEVSYLLQRIENHSGLIILASNFKSNIDSAFIRRFQSIIHFPMPKANERLTLWKNSLPNNLKLDKSIDIDNIAYKYELTGASIINIVQHVCLQTLANDKKKIESDLMIEGIKKEYHKEGKIFK